MKALITLMAFALVAGLPLPSAAAEGETSLQIQQRQQIENRKKTSKPRQPKPVATVPVPAPGTTCNMDGRPVEDHHTWCQQGMVHQCNAKQGTWINMARKCT